MISKLKKLQDKTQRVLYLAACIGADFNLDTLSIISEESAKEVFSDLKQAIHAGLISSASELNAQLQIQNYRFEHDRIQQATYSLSDEVEKKATHLKIARLLLQSTPSDILPEKIFEIVDHFNLASSLITRAEEREEIARLNLIAGQKAKAATAYKEEDVVLSNATIEGVFTREPYIVKNQSKSLLCTPIIDRGKLTGILYLENNLTAGVFTPDRLEVLKILSSQAAISIENARLYQNLEDKVAQRTAQLAEANQEISALNQKLKAENFRMSAELDIVKQLQQMVLPKQSELEAVEGLEIAGFMEPADEVGGDYYDVLQQDDRVKISIGDVTGHGLESGVLMIMAQTAVRTLQKMNETDPVKFLDVLNQTIYDNLQRIESDRNMTLAILDYAGGAFRLSGQHEEVIVVRADGTLECIDTMDLGFPIGLVDEIGDFIVQTEVQLNSGDVVVLYTDGIPEAKDINKAQYGLERLRQVLVENRLRSAAEIREAVIDDVRKYIGTQKVFDDITLVVMKQK